MSKIKLSQFFLGLILFVGVLIRFINLGSLPAGFHGDEAAFGYNAYSILKTGTDEYGRRFPLILQSFGDYKPAIYSYIAIPFIAVLGLNETATRIPSALFGSFSIIMIYLISKRLFKDNEFLALTSSLLLTISPWHIILSRTTSEVVVSVFFLMLMIYAYFRLNEKFKIQWFYLVILSGCISFSAYTAARFFIPIISMLFILFSFFYDKKRKSLNINVLIFIIFIFCELIYNSIANNTRFNQINIFRHPEIQLRLEEQIREDQHTPVLITRLFHNKLINYSKNILKNYLQYFTLDFLALSGGLPIRQKIPDSGLFYIWEIFFLITGVLLILRRFIKNEIKVLVLWLVLLIPSAITFDDVPNIYRALVSLPFILIVVAIGIEFFWKKVKLIRFKIASIIFLFCITIVLYESSYFFHQYRVHGEIHQPWFRDYALKGLVQAINNYSPDFKSVLITKSKTSYIHFLFFNKTDPKIYQKSGSRMDKDHTGWDKIMFVFQECPLFENVYTHQVVGNPNILYVNAGTCSLSLKNTEIVTTVSWQDGSPAFKLLRYIPNK